MMWMRYADRLHSLVGTFVRSRRFEQDSYASLVMDHQAATGLGRRRQRRPAART